MKFTKMNITGQLDSRDAEKLARRIGTSYIVAAIGAAIGVACIGMASFIYAIRWW